MDIIQPVYDRSTGTFGSLRIRRNPWHAGSPPEGVNGGIYLAFFGPRQIHKVRWNHLFGLFDCPLGLAFPREIKAWRHV